MVYNQLKASIGKGKYKFYLLVVSMPYWAGGALDIAGSAENLSEEEAILDDVVEPSSAETAASSASDKPIHVVATPKPIGPNEWMTSKTKVAEMMSLHKTGP